MKWKKLGGFIGVCALLPLWVATISTDSISQAQVVVEEHCHAVTGEDLTGPPVSCSTTTTTIAPTTTTAASTTSVASSVPATTAAPTSTTPSVGGTFVDGFTTLEHWSALAHWSVGIPGQSFPGSLARLSDSAVVISTADQSYGDGTIRADRMYDVRQGGAFRFDVSLQDGNLPATGAFIGFPYIGFSDQPVGAPSYFDDNGKGTGLRNGGYYQFFHTCALSWQTGHARQFVNYNETVMPGEGTCLGQVTLTEGRLNRVELRYDGNGGWQLWASNAGTTGPLVKLRDFTMQIPEVGYFLLGSHNHSALKYSNGARATANATFDNVSFPAAGYTASFPDGSNVVRSGATTAHVSFNGYAPPAVSTYSVTINGATVPVTPHLRESRSFPASIEVPLSAVRDGANTITVQGFQNVANVDLVLTGGAPTTSPPPPATTAPQTTQPSTTALATTTTTSPTPTTTSPPVGAQFFEDFSSPSSPDRFVFQRIHGNSPPAADQLAHRFMGDHDLACSNPNTTKRGPIEFEATTAPMLPITGVGPNAYRCAPGGNPAAAHLMTVIDTPAYAHVDFMPNQIFNNVSRICFDVSWSDLGGRKWIQVGVIPEALFQRNERRMSYARDVFEGDGNVAAGAEFVEDGAFLWTAWHGAMETDNGETSQSFGHGLNNSFIDGAPRFTHCIRDNGNGTVTITRPDFPSALGGPETRTMPGVFPDGPARVIFMDVTYDAQKAGPPYSSDRVTWHWDNIEVTS